MALYPRPYYSRPDQVQRSSTLAFEIRNQAIDSSEIWGCVSLGTRSDGMSGTSVILWQQIQGQVRVNFQGPTFHKRRPGYPAALPSHKSQQEMSAKKNIQPI